MAFRSLVFALACLMLAACNKEASAPADSQTAAAPVAEEKALNIYNWSDYIAPDTIANFEKETGIKVTYDVFDGNETLEAKLLAGNSGYDIVVPSLQYLGRQVKAGVYQPIDRNKLSNYANLDPEMMARIAQQDKNNAYGVPWLMGTTGIGFNVDKVKQRLGDMPMDSWDIIFKPENMAKLKDCGVAVLDTPSELIPIALNYLGENPNSTDEAVIRKAEVLLKSIRPYIRYFQSSQYINDLANGDICLALGWSGDVFTAQTRAEEAKNDVNISYVIPKEGAPMFFDMMAIPKDAKHPQNAHAFMNYILRPEVMAAISNEVSYANANKAATPMVDKELLDNPGVYPTPEASKKLFVLVELTPQVDRLYTDIWTALKTGN